MLKTLIVTSGRSKFYPSQFLKYINSHIIKQIGENFLTAVYMVYDSESRVVKLSRGGHPYPLLIRRGVVSDLMSKGGMIGVLENSDFEEISVILETGDKILLYTDGLTEELNHHGEMFEDTFFKDVLPSIINLPVEDIVSVSWERLVEFKGDDRISDDVCIVGIEIT
jgi:serine phosphatase RsbU (regulator of sigma subunit)